MSTTTQSIITHFRQAVETGESFTEPYQHWMLSDALPEEILHALSTLPFGVPEPGPGLGARSKNAICYFDAENMARFPAMRALANAFQDTTVTRLIADRFRTHLDDTFLRVVYAIDVDGFWLEPHTDVVEKKLTCVIYLTDGGGTDLYWDKERHCRCAPSEPGRALAFVPSERTWHGFEKRPIRGVRKSLILSYVTHDWRDREQLSFPEAPVRVA